MTDACVLTLKCAEIVFSSVPVVSPQYDVSQTNYKKLK